MIKEKIVFKGLDQRDLGILTRNAEVLNLEAGTAVIRENDREERIIMVCDGSLQIEKNGHPYNPRRIGILKPGDIFGEISFVSRQPSPVSVVAQKTTSLFIINRQSLGSLGRDLELFFHRRILAAAKERIQFYERRIHEKDLQNRELMNRIFCQGTDQIPGIEASEFIREVISRIPRLPVFALSLTGKLMADDISSREIAREVRKDPSLAGIILKTINSSYHGMAKKISDLHDAIVFLGFNTVSQIAVAEGLRRSLPDSPLFRSMYNHSQAISHISFEIARKLNISRPSEISTISILHDLGQIVIQLLKMKNPKVATLFDRMDSSQIGAMLLESWGLPDVICETVRYQSYPWFALPEKIPESVRNQVAVLFLSHLCCDCFQAAEPGQASAPVFFETYLKAVHVRNESLPVFVRHQVLPGLNEKIKCLPDSFAGILGDFSRRAGFTAA